MSTTKNKNTETIKNRKISDFLNNEIAEFGKYVITSRALPNLSDGLRTGARKIIYAALTGALKNGKKSKLPTLIGDTLHLQYLHGNASLKNTAEQLSMSHKCKLNPLEIIGQIPTLRIKAVNTAERYLYVKNNEKNIDIYRKHSEIWNIKEEEGYKVEPEHFYPIVPMVLLQRTNSPGFGFSFLTFSHKLSDVIDACIRYLISGTSNDTMISMKPTLNPEVEGINQENFIYNASLDSWFNIGEYNIDFEENMLEIFDLPYDVDLDDYEKMLKEYQESYKILKYQDFSDGNNIHFVIKFPKGVLKQQYNKNKWNFFRMFKLYSKLPKLALNVIAPDGSIQFNETPFDLIDNFCKYRLDIYNKYKQYQINRLQEIINHKTDLMRFITYVVDDVLVINRRPIAEIKKDCDRLDVSYNGLDLKVTKFTEDEINKLQNEITELQSELDTIKNTTEKDMYLKDLIEMKHTFIDDFKIQKIKV